MPGMTPEAPLPGATVMRKPWTADRDFGALEV